MINDVADKMPDHAEFIARLPPSSAAQPAGAAPKINFNLQSLKG